jgi:hypothetical protein
MANLKIGYIIGHLFYRTGKPEDVCNGVVNVAVKDCGGTICSLTLRSFDFCNIGV